MDHILGLGTIRAPYTDGSSLTLRWATCFSASTHYRLDVTMTPQLLFLDRSQMAAVSTNWAWLDFRLAALIWLHEHSGCTDPNRHRQRYCTNDQPHHAQTPYYTRRELFDAWCSKFVAIRPKCRPSRGIRNVSEYRRSYLATSRHACVRGWPLDRAKSSMMP